MLFVLLWAMVVPAGSVATDMSQISNIMRSEMIPDLAKEMVQASLLGLQGTPEARDAIEVILGYLENLLTSVEQKHNATQEEINNRVNTMQAHNQTVVQAIGNATIQDTGFVNCSHWEKDYKDLRDDWWANLTLWCWPNVEYACRDANLTIRAEIPQETFTCSHSEKNCQPNFDIFKGNIRTKNSTIHENVRREVDRWLVKWHNCTVYSNVTRDVRIEFEKYRELHAAQQRECNEDKHVTIFSVCEVKGDGENFCDKVQEFYDLKNNTETIGNIWSDPDRQQEWFAIKHAQCLLTQVLANATINHNDPACTAPYNFQLEYYETTVTSMLQFWNCSLKAIAKSLNGTGVERVCPDNATDDCGQAADVVFSEDFVWSVKGPDADEQCGAHCSGLGLQDTWNSQAVLPPGSDLNILQEHWNVSTPPPGQHSIVPDKGGDEFKLWCDPDCVMSTQTWGQGYAHWITASGGVLEGKPYFFEVLLDGQSKFFTTKVEQKASVSFTAGQILTFKLANVSDQGLKVKFNCYTDEQEECVWGEVNEDMDCELPWHISQ